MTSTTTTTTRRLRAWRRPRVVVPALVALLVAMAVLGGRLGRAETVASYRPELPPSVLDGACDPLPSGVHLDLLVQLRADRTVTPSGGPPARRLDLQYDDLDLATARRRVQVSLRDGGFAPVPPARGADPTIEQWWARPGYGRVGVAVSMLPDVAPDAVVRGRLAVDLPVSSLAPQLAEECDNPVQTKRYPEYAAFHDDLGAIGG